MAPLAALTASHFADAAKRNLLTSLEGIVGKKNLVIEQELAGPVGLCVKFSTLQEYGVDRVFFLENNNVDGSQRNIVFMVRGDGASQVLRVAEQIKRVRSDSPQDHEFTVVWIPRRTLLSNQLLEDSGVLGEVNIKEVPIQLLPLSSDLLSLELPHAFRDLYLHRDPACIFSSASALMQLQQEYGLFLRILGKGNHAKRLADLLLRMRAEASLEQAQRNKPLKPSTTMESLIIIDREVDFASVLLTQLTYEGLIDEIFHIDSNQVELTTNVAGSTNAQPSQSSSQQGLKRKVQLDGSDALYSTLRDANFAVVGPMLNKVARRLQATYESRHTAAKTTPELKEFVSKLPGYQQEQTSLKLHTNLAEEIIKYTRSETFSRILEVQQNIAAGVDPNNQHDNVSELIARDTPLPQVLRLLCLESVISGGIKSRDLENFKQEIVHGYGHEHLITLAALEKMGLLAVRSSAAASVMQSTRAGSITDYSRVRRQLRLIFEEVDETEPDDIAYAYSGYAPLSVRLLQCIIQKSHLTNLTSVSRTGSTNEPATTPSSGALTWKPFEESVRHVRGQTFSEVQLGDEAAVKARQLLNGTKDNVPRTILVFFLGGVCRAEIAAVRWVGRKLEQSGSNLKLVIATTAVLRGDEVIGAAVERKSFAASASPSATPR